MRYWGLTPATWARESFDARAAMLAFMLFENTREAYQLEWREQHKGGKRSSSDESSYAAMRQRLRRE